MKKLIKLLLIGLIVSSCSDSNSVTIPKEEYNKLKGDTIRPEYPKQLIVGSGDEGRAKFLIELASDGHEYAHNINYYYDAYVCFHYPDCNKCNKNKKDTL